MKRQSALVLLFFGMFLIHCDAQGAVVEWVTVSDQGNVDDYTSYGGVNYTFRIGKYEVTNSQYCEFLNAVAGTDIYGLYNINMASGVNDTGGITRSGSHGSYTYSVRPGHDNNPVNYVSWYDTLRFTNWLHNGKPIGQQNSDTTEDGAYTFSDAMVVGPRNPWATVFLTSEDEWYKAAYYKSGGIDAGYWIYATQNNTSPTLEPPPGGDNSANAGSCPAYGLTNVGAYVKSISAYGTYDQNGNLAEWNETMVKPNQWCLRGGSFDINPLAMASYNRTFNGPQYLESWNFGFRVASIPEPSTLLLLGLGALFLRRKK